MSCKYKICEDVFSVPRVYYVYNNIITPYNIDQQKRNYHMGAGRVCA